ncbi:MAG TPA: hypothetical protein VFY79_12130 [Dehalococcoidia bacterium]|jgi:hypothetical protein|nr:hypothetical protein [Dehalococcoidia bacterium]
MIWNTAERRALDQMKSASQRVAAKTVSPGSRGVRRRCDGPFVLHEDGRIVCTGICQHGKIWERVPFLGWDHLKAKKLRCDSANTTGRSCERCTPMAPPASA